MVKCVSDVTLHLPELSRGAAAGCTITHSQVSSGVCEGKKESENRCVFIHPQSRSAAPDKLSAK